MSCDQIILVRGKTPLSTKFFFVFLFSYMYVALKLELWFFFQLNCPMFSSTAELQIRGLFDDKSRSISCFCLEMYVRPVNRA